MSQYVKQTVSMDSFDRDDFRNALTDERFKHDFTIDFDNKRITERGMVVIPDNQRDVDAVVTFKNSHSGVGIVFNEEGGLEVRGDFYSSGIRLEEFSKQIAMIYNAYKVARAAQMNNYMVNILSQSRQEIKLECLG